MTTSELIQKTLGPDVRTEVWAGQVMPYDAVYERRISAAHTRTRWLWEHADDTDYHQRFRGYCPHCQKERID